jgi:hypothetical protein
MTTNINKYSCINSPAFGDLYQDDKGRIIRIKQPNKNMNLLISNVDNQELDANNDWSKYARKDNMYKRYAALYC